MRRTLVPAPHWVPFFNLVARWLLTVACGRLQTCGDLSSWPTNTVRTWPSSWCGRRPWDYVQPSPFAGELSSSRSAGDTRLIFQPSNRRRASRGICFVTHAEPRRRATAVTEPCLSVFFALYSTAYQATTNPTPWPSPHALLLRSKGHRLRSHGH